MPKVYLTEQQRIDARYEQIRKRIGDRIVISMHRNHHTQSNVYNHLAMGHSTFRKLLDGEDVTMTTTRFLQILDLAGLVLVDRKKDEMEAAK